MPFGTVFDRGWRGVDRPSHVLPSPRAPLISLWATWPPPTRKFIGCRKKPYRARFFALTCHSLTIRRMLMLVTSEQILVQRNVPLAGKGRGRSRLIC